ncbi:hypothetical protein D3C72_2097460 [compost metagenome]
MRMKPSCFSFRGPRICSEKSGTVPKITLRGVRNSCVTLFRKASARRSTLEGGTGEGSNMATSMTVIRTPGPWPPPG